MKKGIGPRGLGAPKSAAKMYGKSPAKQTGDGKKPIVHTDEMGRKGHFNPYTKDSKSMGGQHRTHPRNAGRTEYSKDYQNVFIRNTSGDRSKGIGASIGDNEHTMKRKHKFNNVMEMRRNAYDSHQSNFGVKKPKVNIK